MNYRYRISKNVVAGFEVQRKISGLWGMFLPWSIVTIESSFHRAQIFCWEKGLCNVPLKGF